MPQRTTVMLDDEILKKIRIRQAREIRNSAKSVSLSSIINQIIKECIDKNHKSK